MAKFLRLAVWLLCLLPTSMVQASIDAQTCPAAVILDDLVTTIDIASQLDVFKAEEQGLNLQQISSPPYSQQFIPNTTAATNYGFNYHDVWLRFNIQSQSAASWYLMLDRLILGEAEIFILPQNGEARHILTDSNSLLTPIANHRTPAWKVNLPQGEVYSIYLRLFNPKDALMLSVTLMQENAFITHSNARYVFFSIVLMGIMTLAIYNLFLAFSLQDKSYLFLFSFTFLMGCLIYRVTNLFPSLHDIFIPIKSSYYTSIWFLTMATAAYYWYTLHQGTEKWLENFLKWLAWVSLLLFVLANIFPLNTTLFFIIITPTLFILPGLTIRAIMLGHKNILNHFLSMLLLVVSVGLYTPLYMGQFPDYPLISHDIGQVGVMLAILLFSLNHADRTRHLRAQAERIEANNKATHNFLASMSHELRTPMHTVLGANELLKTTSPNKVQQSYINSSDLASHQMLTLIEDILDTARLHNSQPISIDKRPFCLHETAADLEELFNIQARKSKIHLIINAKELPFIKYIGDEKHINQVLVNLVGNAIKYTNSGSVILTINRDKENNSENQEMPIYFSVQDTGPGIPLEQHSLLFQPFFQVDSGRSRRQDGAGLGLAISYKLVQQMGGELQVESTPGKGSCFFFTLNLPAYDEANSIKHEEKVQRPQQTAFSHKNRLLSATELAPPIQAKTEPDTKPLSGLKTLLVDDGELNLLIGGQLLTAQGAEVTLAESGKEALRLLTKQAFDLVLMDISMPGMDGYETTRMIRQNTALQSLPVIALTAHAIQGERARCLAAGMNDYLSKPFQMSDLLEMISQHGICPNSHPPKNDAKTQYSLAQSHP